MNHEFKVIKATKKPVTIQAVQFTTNNQPGNTQMYQIVGWICAGKEDLINGRPPAHHDGTSIFIETLEGQMRADCGDYIIKGVNGEFYPCKSDIFRKTYDIPDELNLQRFKCHKEVHATEMTDAQYKAYYEKNKGQFKMAIPQPKVTRDVSLGFLVVYSLGTNEEYRAWSPGKAFIEGYNLIPDDFLGRITNEAAELKVNLDKLSAFIDSDKFLDLDRDNCLQLQNQRDHMQGYWDTLMKRIELNQ